VVAWNDCAEGAQDPHIQSQDAGHYFQEIMGNVEREFGRLPPRSPRKGKNMDTQLIALICLALIALLMAL
jgi:hypothetical protein